ncbi:helix-turn-helix transcriptional regulator [Nocardiopsis sp. NPDC055551]
MNDHGNQGRTSAGTGIDPGEHRVLADPSRVAVLQILRRSDHPMDVREIAEVVGLHANTVRSHLALLTDRGLVLADPEERDRPGRPRTLYTPADDDEQRDYRMLAEALVAHLSAIEGDQAEAAVRAGQAQGERLIDSRGTRPPVDADTARATVTDLLRETGFRPRPSPDGTRIDLRHCPFREVAEAAPDVVCGVHLGMIRGALERMRAPVEAVRLRPFATPGHCVAELRETEVEDPPGS